MAIDSAYSDSASYRARHGKTDTADDAAILTDLRAISRYLDARLGQHFNADAADVTRLIAMTADNVDGLTFTAGNLAATPTTIKLADGAGAFTGASLVVDTDYTLGPRDAAYGPEVRPYSQLVLKSASAFRWIIGRDAQIVGRFGWPAVPPGIKVATEELTAILRLETPRATSRISELDGTIEASPAAQSIINKLLDAYRMFFFA